jgi:ankyrin repeat protein
MNKSKAISQLTNLIESGDVRRIKTVLQGTAPNVTLNIVGFSFFTPLLYAARLGKFEVVEFLVDLKDVNLRALDNYGQNALQNAVFSGSVETARLLRNHLSPMDKDSNENSCLHIAVMQSLEMTKL